MWADAGVHFSFLFDGSRASDLAHYSNSFVMVSSILLCYV